MLADARRWGSSSLMRFLHSADWQIGARFDRFGARAELLREARLRTFRKSLEIAREREVDAFLIAGDLFEDHQVDAASVRVIHEAIREFASVPIFILPGNHDPASGPAAVWERPPFSLPLGNLKIFKNAEAVPIGTSAWLLASPLTQKRSTVDPSLRLVKLADETPHGTIRIGLTHGALAIGGKHAVDDFPIAMNAATRAGLDYLAVGHWHSRLCIDEGRIMMPGTPEPTDFGESGAGYVHLVEIEAPGALPRIEAIKVASFSWLHLVCDARDPAAVIAKLRREASDAAVVRVTLQGACSEAERAMLLEELGTLLARCAAADIRDETQPTVTSIETERARAEHPLLAGVLDDLAAIGGDPNAARWPAAELADLARRVGCDVSELTPEITAEARRLLFSHLRECQAPC